MAERRYAAGRPRLGVGVRAAVTAVVAALVLTGCVSLPGERTVTDKEWTPATTEALTTWMQAYDKALAQGAKTHDPKRIRKMTGNALNSSLSGAYRLAERTGSDPAVIAHEDPTFYLPQMDDYPLRGLAVATNPKTGQAVLELLDRQSARADWRSLISVELDEGVQLPKLKTDGDYPVEPPLNDKGNLRRSPAKMARAFGGLLAATGGDSPFAVFSQHQVVDERIAQNAAYEDSGAVTVEHEAAEPTAVRAFETTDGSALVLAGLQDKLQLQIDGAADLPEQLAAYVGSDGTAGSTVEATYAWQVAFLVPPKSKAAETEARILGVQRSLAEVVAG